ncbi:hypothetical protein ABEX78_23660 [Priestia megaterium]
MDNNNVWKQAYKLNFKGNNGWVLSKTVVLTNEPDHIKDQEKLCEQWKAEVEREFGITVSKGAYNSELLVHIISEQEPTYVAAKWLCDNLEIENEISSYDYDEAVEATGSEDKNIVFDIFKEYVEMIELLNAI